MFGRVRAWRRGEVAGLLGGVGLVLILSGADQARCATAQSRLEQARAFAAQGDEPGLSWRDAGDRDRAHGPADARLRRRSDGDIAARLKSVGARFTLLSEDALVQETSRALANEQAVCWFQGHMELRPRALGARSIIGDARSSTMPKMPKMLDLKIKYRGSFRPFAPAVLREQVADWLELDRDSPYMLLVASVKSKRCRTMTEDEKKLWGTDRLNVARSDIPAVTHVDDSVRVQSVHAGTNAKFHALLAAFNGLTDCRVLVNTSFNVRGEPIVGTPADQRAGDRQLLPAQSRSRRYAEAGLRGQVRVRLRIGSERGALKDSGTADEATAAHNWTDLRPPPGASTTSSRDERTACLRCTTPRS